MSDYIKREDAIRTMAQYMMDMALIDNPEASDRIEQWEGSIAAPVMSTVKAADVRENVKGEWKIEYTGDGWNDYIDVTCTNCGKTIKHGKPFNFCPICGADMRPITALSKKCRN